jgi:hypothetical protein
MHSATTNFSSLPASLLALASLACGANSTPGAGTTPVYDRETGKLTYVLSDRNGDGRPDARAHMDGPRVRFVEIDRNGDGRYDRWEYYSTAVEGPSVIERATEASGPSDRTTRHEFYDHGLLARVDEDVDTDGRADKWEYYEAGRLRRLELDVAGRGQADRRLFYGRDGQVERVEADPDGDGRFEPSRPRDPQGQGRDKTDSPDAERSILTEA